MQPIIQNIISTVDTECVLDLKHMARSALNVEYKPQRFGALIMRIREPRSTALMFKSGNIVVAGTKTLDDSKRACKKFVKIINKLGFKAVFSNFRIQNIVCTYDMKNLLSLEKIYLFCENFSCYEPELFPGLILRVRKAVFLIFGSGKVVITGLKDYKEIKLIFVDVFPILEKYKRI